MTQMTILRVPGVSSAPGLKRLARDPILEGAGGGCLFAFDLSFGWCYDGSTAPSDGKAIRDLAEKGNGALSIRSGQTLANGGGGIDFSGVTNDACEIRGPVGCLDPLQDEQEFAVVTWMKLPALGDWNTASSVTAHFTTSDSGGYAAGADLLTLGQMNNPLFSARRQTNGSTVATLNAASAGFYGKVCQVLYARTALATVLRIRSDEAQIVVTGAAGSLNAADFSALRPRWGVVEALNNLAAGGDQVAHRNAAKYRIYRGFIENLQQSGRDPIELADLDFDFINVLGRYS